MQFQSLLATFLFFLKFKSLQLNNNKECGISRIRTRVPSNRNPSPISLYHSGLSFRLAYLNRGTQRLFSLPVPGFQSAAVSGERIKLHTGKTPERLEQATVFCKISVRRSKYYLEFSITWGRLIFKMTVPLTHNFRSLSYKFPTIFWSLIIRISLPRLGYFSSRKGNLKCSDLKIWWREKSGKFSLWFRNALNCL